MYRFQYSVGDMSEDEDTPQFGQEEHREGEVTRGSYHVLLPDGRLQRVDYEADEHGFRPTVSFEEPTQDQGVGAGQRVSGGPY